MMKKIRGLFLSFLLLLISISAFSQHKTMISGKVLSTERTTVDFATVYLKVRIMVGLRMRKVSIIFKLPRENIHWWYRLSDIRR